MSKTQLITEKNFQKKIEKDDEIVAVLGVAFVAVLVVAFVAALEAGLVLLSIFQLKHCMAPLPYLI